MSTAARFNQFTAGAVGWASRQLQKRVPYEESNFFLEGQFAPVAQERTETQLAVTGVVPAELNGLYARIGPNPIHVANPALYHWFLGDGMVHGLRLRDGQALDYRNRWVATSSAYRVLGRPLPQDAPQGAIDVVNTNVLAHAGRIWALVESGPVPAQLDGELATLQRSLFNRPQAGGYSAHPHRDPETGALHAICYDGLSRRVYHRVVDARGDLLRSQEIPLQHGPMIHDCAITRSQVVVLDLPVTFSLRAFLGGASFPYRWNPKHPARVGLLPMNGSADEIRWFEVDPCFVFHTCNAFETDDGSVVLDVVVHPEMFNTARHGPELARVSFERWTLRAGSAQVQRELRSDRNQEFPRFDERLTGRPYRYAYTAATVHGTPTDGRQPLYRHDLQTGQTQVHDYGAGRVTGEAVFVPRHAQAAEDDGWLLSYVLDLAQARSELVILNAADFEGEPQAVVHLPLMVPAGFHGNWIADAELSAS